MYDSESLSQQFIHGVWRPGTGATEVLDVDPWDQSLLTSIRGASTADVDAAYAAATAAQPNWAATNPYVRRAVLEKAIQEVESHRAELGELIRRELGGTVLKAALELGLVLDMLKEAATMPLRMEGRIMASSQPNKENRVYREPVGVVTVIAPFNTPLFLCMKSVAPALALGNAVVIKPHEQTPLVGGTVLARIFEQAGLPPGVLNVVVGDIAELGDHVIAHPATGLISFTGSTAVGRHIGEVAARTFTRCVLELGGNSALLVLDDADLDLAVDAAVFSRFTHQGQICMSANRVVVDRRVHDEFLERYLQKVSSLTVGDPGDPATVIGPLISASQADRLQAQVEDALAGGAVAALQGKREDNLIWPSVLIGITADMPVAQQELFGPVALIMVADGDDDAVRIANDSPYGLSGAVHSRDLERAIAVARRIETGMVHVNNATIDEEMNVPFGGEKLSGGGRLNGEASIEEFTRLKLVSVSRGRPTFPY